MNAIPVHNGEATIRYPINTNDGVFLHALLHTIDGAPVYEVGAFGGTIVYEQVNCAGQGYLDTNAPFLQTTGQRRRGLVITDFEGSRLYVSVPNPTPMTLTVQSRLTGNNSCLTFEPQVRPDLTLLENAYTIPVITPQ